MIDSELTKEISLIVEQLLDSKEVIGINDDITNLLDSINLIQLIVEIERTYNIHLLDDDFHVKNFRDIESITKIVTKYL